MKTRIFRYWVLKAAENIPGVAAPRNLSGLCDPFVAALAEFRLPVAHWPPSEPEWTQFFFAR